MAGSKTGSSTVKLGKLFIELANFYEAGTPHGITVDTVMNMFSLTNEGARLVLTGFYQDYAELLDLKMGFYVTRKLDKTLHPPPAKCFDGSDLIPIPCKVIDAGRFATEDELKVIEETEDVDQVQIFCVHPEHLDDSRLFTTEDFVRPIKKRNPLVTIHPKTEVVDPEFNALKTIEKKQREQAKLEALFDAAGKKEKFASPKGKGKNTEESPEKNKKNFFLPSPKKTAAKDDESAPPPAKKAAVSRNLMMDDCFTTGEDEDEREMPVDESVYQYSKTETSRYRPKQMSAKAASKVVRGTAEKYVKMEVDVPEDADTAGSSAPSKVKRMQVVTETYMADDDDGEGAFLVTEANKKMVETNEEAPAAPKAKKTAAPKAAANTAKKGQSSLLSFFKKT